MDGGLYNYIPHDIIHGVEKDNAEGYSINLDNFNVDEKAIKEKDGGSISLNLDVNTIESKKPTNSTYNPGVRKNFEAGTATKITKKQIKNLNYLKINQKIRTTNGLFSWSNDIPTPPLLAGEKLMYTKYDRPFKLVSKYTKENSKMKIPQLKPSELAILAGIKHDHGEIPENEVEQMLNTKVIFNGEIIGRRQKMV